MASQTQTTISQTPPGPVPQQSEERNSVPANIWLGSRSSIMVLVSVILIFAATAIVFLADRSMSADKHMLLGWQFLMPIADAMLVVSVTVLLTELGPFRSYVEERLQSLKQLLDRPVFDRLTDATYLRDNFSPERIREVQRASTCACLPAHIKDYPEFLKVIEKCVLPLAAETIWRRDFHLNLSHTLHGQNGQTFLRQKSTLSATYFNTGNGIRTLNIPIVRKYPKLPGFSNEQLCSNGWAKLQTEGSVNETLIPLIFHQTDLGDTVQFEAKFSVAVGPRPVFVSTGYEAIVGPNETYRQSFSVPTAGLTVTYQHPANVRPELHCFNLGGELKVIVKEETLHQWEHSGTFLPNHGAVLTHSLARRMGERATTQKVDLPVERRRA
jgi:hypothetical protein